MKFYQENFEKLSLKHEGHSLVDKIKWKGYSKDNVYVMLAKEMGVEEHQAHFKKINRLSVLRVAVEALRRLEAKIPRTEKASVIYAWKDKVKTPELIGKPKPAPKKSKLKKDTLPRTAYAEILKEVAKANGKRHEART